MRGELVLDGIQEAVDEIAGFGGAVILGDLDRFVDADQSGDIGAMEKLINRDAYFYYYYLFLGVSSL